jgi:hypothetical protein
MAVRMSPLHLCLLIFKRFTVQGVNSEFEILGLDHGVGHPLLLLYDVKAPNGQNSNEFNGSYYYPSDVSLSTF